jgi:hypothetical protein
MNFSEAEEIRYNRQSKQHALDTFTFDFDNTLDRPIDKLIRSTQAKINELSENYHYYQKLQKEKSATYWEIEKKHSSSGGVDMIMMDQIIDMTFLEDELMAISETKIIYGYKHFEISLNKLIRIAFGNNNSVKTFRWEDVRNFFKSKKIKISDLKGFNELNQFRSVNNMIKHSDYKVDPQIKNIKEFSKSTDINHIQLLKFYNRVKQSPQIFLSSLIIEIQKYLYDFSPERIDKIAQDFALRMDKETTSIFIEKLKGKY